MERLIGQTCFLASYKIFTWIELTNKAVDWLSARDLIELEGKKVETARERGSILCQLIS
jgi:hypothetical protein